MYLAPQGAIVCFDGRQMTSFTVAAKMTFSTAMVAVTSSMVKAALIKLLVTTKSAISRKHPRDLVAGRLVMTKFMAVPTET